MSTAKEFESDSMLKIMNIKKANDEIERLEKLVKEMTAKISASKTEARPLYNTQPVAEQSARDKFGFTYRTLKQHNQERK